MENGNEEMPDTTVSKTTLKGPSCNASMAEIIVATARRIWVGCVPIIFL